MFVPESSPRAGKRRRINTELKRIVPTVGRSSCWQLINIPLFILSYFFHLEAHIKGVGLFLSFFWYFPAISPLFVIVSITHGKVLTTGVRTLNPGLATVSHSCLLRHLLFNDRIFSHLRRHEYKNQ